MFKKNLLTGYRKVFVFLTFVVLSFFLLNIPRLNVWGQESTDTTSDTTDAITDVEDFTADAFSSDDALLFVQESSEASQSLLDYLEQFRDLTTETFHLYVVNVPTSGDVFTEYKSLYDDICSAENFIVPTMIYQDNCILGYDSIATDLAIRFKLEIENAELQASIEENVAELDSAVDEVNSTVESKTFFDWVAGLETTTLIGIGGALVVGIAIVVLLIVFRKKLRGKRRLISSIAPVLVLAGSMGYLVYTVNNAQKDFSPLESSAGCIEDNNCATWADRVADGIASGGENSEQIQHYQAIQEQMAEDEENFGSNAAHLKDAAAYENSTLLSEIYGSQLETLTTSKGTYTYDSSTGSFYDSDGIPRSISYVFQGVTSSSQVDTTGTTISSTAINTYIEAAGINVVEESEIIEEEKSKYVLSDGKYCVDSKNTIISCPNACDCGGGVQAVECCSTVSYTLAEDKLAFKYDSGTGTVVIVPTGKAVFDECEGGDGNNITAKLLCNCGDGIWTSAYSAVSCDAVCRVENLICDDCNPEEPPPPEIQSGDYCGDGILGNTDGEVCEYGDPSGVECSWNTCSGDCTCPDTPDPYCGDGIINQDSEQCELGDPDGAEYTWDECNHVNCRYIVPGCGDGTLDEGESCERSDPDGVSCLWDTECNQTSCTCTVEQSPTCGDGTLDEGETCEEGNPSGYACDWAACSKSTCTCPGSNPGTAIFDDSQTKLLVGFGLLVLGFVVTPLTRFLSNYYMKVGNGLVKIGKYQEEKKRESFEKKVLKKK